MPIDSGLPMGDPGRGSEVKVPGRAGSFRKGLYSTPIWGQTPCRFTERRRRHAAWTYRPRLLAYTVVVPSATRTAVRITSPSADTVGAGASGGHTVKQHVSGAQVHVDVLHCSESCCGQLTAHGVEAQQALFPGGQKDCGGPTHWGSQSEGAKQNVQPGWLTLNSE